jgi:hypothetical protein
VSGHPFFDSLTNVRFSMMHDGDFGVWDAIIDPGNPYKGKHVGTEEALAFPRVAMIHLMLRRIARHRKS